MSIALFNIRLTTLTTQLWKYVNYVFFAICTAYTLVALCLNVFKCSPIYASYDLLRIADSGKVPKCLSVNSTNSILRLNLALDFTALAIPVIVLWKVQLSWKKKARIFGLLSIGLIACIASVMTLVSQYTLAKDPLWSYTTLLAWIMVELVVSLIAACAPTLAYLLPRAMMSTHNASNSAGKLTGQKSATGFGSRLSRNEHALRSRTTREEDQISDEEEQCIIVKKDIRMKRQSIRPSPRSVTNGNPTNWYDDYRGESGAVVYDGRQHEGGSKAWVGMAR
jgi:hypothetical protein